MLTIGLFFAGLLAYALVSRLLDRASITAQIVMLALGVGLGLAVQGTPERTVDTELLGVAGELALILALAVDAARIDIGALRRTAGLPIRLLVIGLPLTIVVGTIAAILVLPGITVLDAIIVSTLLAPTDAALGAIVINSRFVPRRIRQALNVESGLNDGLVTPIVLVAAALAVAGGDPAGTAWIRDAVAQIAYGALAGIAVGVLGALALRFAIARQWMHDGTHWIAVPAIAFLAWFVAHELGGNVFVAAFAAGPCDDHGIWTCAGVVPGVRRGRRRVARADGVLPVRGTAGGDRWDHHRTDRDLRRPVADDRPDAPGGDLPAGTRLRRPTVAFIGWFGPRGLASIVLTLVALGDGGGAPPFSAAVVSAVVVTIALSVLAHGLSAGPAVARYGAYVATLPEGAAEHESTAELRTRRGVHRRSVAREAPS